jgi:hypothetical protein
MLALGPPERILTTYTPLVFLSLTLVAVWLAWHLSKNLTAKSRIGAILAIGGFLATVPIVRMAITYLNSHILVSYGLTLIAVSIFLASKKRSFGGSEFWVFTLGGAFAATSRVEAILLVGILAVMFRVIGSFDRLSCRRFLLSLLVIGVYLLAWLWGLGTPLAESFGMPYWQLALAGLGGSLILSSKIATKYRHLIPHLLGIALAATLLWTVFRSNNPYGLLLAQWPNFGLGEGGWATAVPVLIALLILLGWRGQSVEYRWLIVNAGLMVMAILFSKTFDGGFGRESFYDSVNRMALHVLPLVVVALIIGVATIFDRLVISLTGQSERRVSYGK